MSDWARTVDELLRARGSVLFGYAYVLSGTKEGADDLLQDALVRTFRSRRAPLELNAAHAYVKRAISTAFIDAGRRAKVRPVVASQDPDDVGMHSPDPTHRLDEIADLHRAILALSPRERACVVLRYLEGMQPSEVAAELGIADGTVKRYLADALSRLRAMPLDVDFSTSTTVPVSEGRSR